MIGLINLPPESPAEFYEQRPLRNGETGIFGERKQAKGPEYFFAPDGRKHGMQLQQSQSAETLWEITLQRSIMCRLARSDSRRRSTSCSNVTVLGGNLAASSQRVPSIATDSDGSTIHSGESTPGKKPSSLPLYSSVNQIHRKPVSSLSRASKFFSLSLPKITHLK